LIELTFEQPGVNAPGTAKRMTVFPLHNSDKFTLLAGVFSNRSMLGTESPTCQHSKIYDTTGVEVIRFPITLTGIFDASLTLNRRLVTVFTDGALLSVFCNAAIMLNMVE